MLATSLYVSARHGIALNEMNVTRCIAVPHLAVVTLASTVERIIWHSII